MTHHASDRFRYGVSTWILGDRPVAEVLDLVRRCGYDGVELAVRPDEDHAVLQQACRRAGTPVLSVCAIARAGASADPTAADPAERAEAVGTLSRLCELAADLEAPAVLSTTVPLYKLAPTGATGSAVTDDRLAAAERARVVEVLGRVGQRAESCGVTVAVEPVNRHEGYMLRTVAEVLALLEEIGSPGVGMTVDTYHMNLEETDVVGAVRAAAGRIADVQVAANDRGTVGRGHVDVEGVLRALIEGGYVGPVNVETVPAASLLDDAVQRWGGDDAVEASLRASLDTLRRAESRARGKIAARAASTAQ